MAKYSCWDKAVVPMPAPNEETGIVNLIIGMEVRGSIGKGFTVWTVGTSQVGGPDRIDLPGYSFRVRPRIGQERMDYYSGVNPQTPTQQNWRYIFAQGIAAWHALSDEKKAHYWAIAKRQSRNGQHYFQSWWLQSHKNVGQPWTVGTTRLGSLDYVT